MLFVENKKSEYLETSWLSGGQWIVDGKPPKIACSITVAMYNPAYSHS